MYLVDESPVKFITTGCWWAISHHPTTGIYTANAFPRTGGWFTADASPPSDPLLRVHAVTSWQLEERLGFALPTDVHEVLRDLALAYQPYPDPTQVTGADALVVPLSFRPSRTSRVDLYGDRAGTYGRLMHANTPARTWTDGTIQIDVIPTAPVTVGGTPRHQLGYRIWHDQTVVIAADDITMPITDNPRGDDTLRAIVNLTVHTPPDRLSPRQRDFLDTHGEKLSDALTPPHGLYPPGVRVTVIARDGQAPTTGIVTGAVTDPDGTVIDYLWRPDLADLPGHPWRDHPDRVMASPAHRVRPTLTPADTGCSRPGVLAFGARVRSVDDPVFTDGTVLRAFREDGGTIYEIQPDDPTWPSVRLPADDVIPTAGTAWPTLNSLLDARDQAGIPLRDGETLTTVREATEVAAGLSGPIPLYPLRRTASHDPVLDPDTLDRADAGYHTSPYGPRGGDGPIAIEPHGAVT
uniref:hypothetical protein n=1 Tax=Candidatus Protofrankia californiensis TaxID=1839754 RepID=UPI0010418CBF